MLTKETTVRQIKINPEALRRKREDVGESQKTYALKLGVSLVTYQLWESGVCNPLWGKTITPEAFSKCLGLSKREEQSILMVKINNL